jgi:replicative DNA helicase
MHKWQEDMENVHNKAEVMIAKQRHGPIKNIEMFFDGKFTRFGDLDTQHSDRGGDFPSED